MPNLMVAQLADLPTDTGHVVRVEGVEIALFRVDEGVCALENVCPHQDGPIGSGWLDKGVVVCPWHCWDIDVRTGRAQQAPDLATRSFPCTVRNGEVWVTIGPTDGAA